MRVIEMCDVRLPLRRIAVLTTCTVLAACFLADVCAIAAEISPEMLTAARSGDLDTVNKLLAQGEGVNAANADGVTALMVAAAENQLKVVRVLLDAGADARMKTASGKTAAFFALGKGNAEVAAILEEAASKPPVVPKVSRTTQPVESVAPSPGGSAPKRSLTPEEHRRRNAALNEAYKAGKSAMENKQYDAAVENFNRAGDIDAGQGAVWASLAQAYEALAKTKTGADFDTNMQKAADTWTKAIALSPDDAGLHNNYALTLAAGKKFPEAQAELGKAATLNPASAGQYYYNLGAVELNAGQNDAASEAFRKATAITPPWPEAFYQYGLTLMAKATFDKGGKIVPVPGAAEAFQRYLQLTPDGPHAQEAKAMLGTLASR